MDFRARIQSLGIPSEPDTYGETLKTNLETPLVQICAYLAGISLFKAEFPLYYSFCIYLAL